MSFKDILTMLVSDTDDAAVSCARRLAQRVGGKASALLLEIQPNPIYLYGGDYIGGEVWVQLLREAHEVFLQTKAKYESRLAALAEEMPLQDRTVSGLYVDAAAALAARYADITVMARPSPGQNRIWNEIFESVLFGSGRPVLLAPADWDGGAIGRTIALGWNAKREAAQALSAAGPLIDRAEKVVVLTVDAKPSSRGHGDEPGADIAAHLARKGVTAEVRNIESNGRSDGASLMEECATVGADLLVIGGYGHSRLEEFVLGGVTRELIRGASIPLLMAH